MPIAKSMQGIAGQTITSSQGNLRVVQGEVMQGTHVLSYGGGVNTSALMVLLVQKKMPFDVAVFADTVAELPETYSYLKVARDYLDKNGVELKVVRSKTGSLYDTCKRRGVVPSKIWRWSTRDYKITPIHAFYRSLGTQIIEYLGIAYDEIERMKPSREHYITSKFPLVDFKMTREDCIKVIKEADLPIPVKSGCFFCPFQDIPRWRELYVKHNDLFLKAMELEESSKHFPKQRLNAHTLRGLMENQFPDGRQPRTLSDVPCGAYCMA